MPGPVEKPRAGNILGIRALSTHPKGTVIGIESRLKAEGLTHVIASLPNGLLSRIEAIRIRMVDCQNPGLQGRRTINIGEALSQLNTTDHVVEFYRSLQLFRSAEMLHAEGKLEPILRPRGNYLSVGIEGLAPSIPIILELSETIRGLLSDPQIEAAVYAGIYLHDIGKFIRQSGHPINGLMLIDNYPQISIALEQHFTADQIKLVRACVAFHSLYSETIILKEADIQYFYRTILGSADTASAIKIFNNLFYALSICDTDAYQPGISRLDNSRLGDLALMHGDLNLMIERGEKAKDLDAREDEIRITWGTTRFRSWVVNEAEQKGGRAKESLEFAEAELARHFNTDAQRTEFYRTLGTPKLIGLIVDLRRELPGPVERARLLVWLYKLIEKTKHEEFEFKIYREKSKWLGPQVGRLSTALQGTSFLSQLDSILRPEIKENGIVEIDL